MMKRKLLAAALSLSLLCAAAVPAFAAEPLRTSPLTRADLVVQLYESAGKPAVNYIIKYSDVSNSADYAEAVRWASSEKLVNGYDDGTFRPDISITREQLAVILYRYALENEKGFTGTWAFLLPYSDTADIHEYAYEAVSWMTMEKVMGAAEGDAFVPNAPVSSSDAEQILTQFAAALKQA